MMLYRIFISLIIILTGFTSVSQEFISDLNDNPELGLNIISAKQKSASIDTLNLPFIDDFSNRASATYPDSKLWVDRYVYINNGYPIGQPTTGVATFDALDEYGRHYSNATDDQFEADKLTSRPIKLKNVDLSSLFISFHYQPQGKGNSPELNDTLILQFKDTSENWITTWKAHGCTYDDFKIDTLNIPVNNNFDTVEFKQVILPVNDSAFLHNGFQFRFVNHASLTPGSRPSEATNCDHWNIDYVYLDSGRNESQFLINDIAFTKPPIPFFKKYTSVPWTHFNAVANSPGYISDMILPLRNNGYENHSLYYSYIYITDNNSDWSDGRRIKEVNELDEYQNYYERKQQFEVSPIIRSDSKDSAEFTVKSYFEVGEQDFIASNDTVESLLKFSNYYAYDDGTAEKRYGIDANGGYVAYRFNIPQTDTLRGVNIFFPRNNPKDNASTTFALCVWKEDPFTKNPGELISIQNGINVDYSENINEYTYKGLDIPILVSGTFFIGWKQLSDKYLHIGFDANRNNKSEIFYNIYGDWINSRFNGSLMIRPVVGKKIEKEINITTQKKQFTISPNPSNGILDINLESDVENASVSIYNLSGQLVKQMEWNGETLDINDINEGIFIVKIFTPDQIYNIQRLIVQY